ncbi:MAG: Gfo/Idh/MocA family oxidoreductase, partial [Lachnospiraceae bacterium]|nr:Gfo/Idh/MocA family oxidoreductase [Lachnospiraceae bacterium]
MRTVITYGVFDVFHEGHIRLLRRAKALGDRLICGVCTDAFAAERGKLLLSDPLQVRLAHVSACEYVDEVIVEDHLGQKVEDIRRFHADVFAIGDDWEGAFDYLKEFCEVVYLPRTPGISSSRLRGNPYGTLRLGIIGSGRIVRRFLEEASHVKGGLSVERIWNPNPGSAERFLEKLPESGLRACGSLEELFESCDAVYIASPHGTHFSYARAALEAGLHVLCEKPLCLKESEAKELFRLSAAGGRVLMEGIKTAYCPGFIRLISVAQSGVIGEIRDIESCFTKLVPKGLREWTDPCGGSFTELGS